MNCFYFIFFSAVHHFLSTINSNCTSIQCDKVKGTGHIVLKCFQLLKLFQVFVGGHFVALAVVVVVVVVVVIDVVVIFLSFFIVWGVGWEFLGSW